MRHPLSGSARLLSFFLPFRIVRCRFPTSPFGHQAAGKQGQAGRRGNESRISPGVEGCLASARGPSLRQSGGKIMVTDGPFTEAKEVVGGMALLKANSMAIELTKNSRAWPATANASSGSCTICRHSLPVNRCTTWNLIGNSVLTGGRGEIEQSRPFAEAMLTGRGSAPNPESRERPAAAILPPHLPLPYLRCAPPRWPG